MNRLIAINLLPLTMLLSACIGFGVIHSKTESYERFKFTSYSDEDLKVITESTSENNPTKEEFVKCWGEPDKIKTEGKNIIWIYKTGIRWIGVVPMIGVGIPIAVPTGKNKTELYFRNQEESPYLALIHYTSWSGGYYGPKDESSMDSGFYKLGD